MRKGKGDKFMKTVYVCFYLSNGYVVNKFNGSSVKMKKEDFIELYRDETFYLKEDNSIFIDDEKDEDYYRYYKK